jgi:hypothetical protein
MQWLNLAQNSPVLADATGVLAEAATVVDLANL